MVKIITIKTILPFHLNIEGGESKNWDNPITREVKIIQGNKN